MKKKKEAINNDLSAMVKRKYRIASEANQEAHNRAYMCLQQIKGTLFDMEVDESDIHLRDIQMNITLPVISGLKALLAEILDPIIAQPFTLSPSPMVELPPDVRERLHEAIEQHLPQLLQMAQGDEQKLYNLIEQFSETTKRYEQESAKKSADALTTVIKARLIDSGFEKEFSDWLYNFMLYPLAIIKAPFYVYEPRRTWGTFGLTYQKQLIAKVKNISPFDFFPAPKAKDPHSCAYIIERMRVHSGQLLDMQYSESGFDTEAIEAVFEDYTRYIIPYLVGNDSDSPPDSDEEINEDAESSEDGYYDILIYYGRILGTELIEYGIEVDDERRFYEAEIWVVGDYVIKASLNPNELGMRPFEVLSYASTTGEMWGKSPTEIIRDSQRQCTLAGRALARNMEFASSPIGEVVSANVMGEADPQEIYPMMLRAVKATANGNPIYRFYSVPSLANELMAVYDKFYKIAYDLIGIPPIAFGDAQGVATLGRTSGGVAMVLNQASKSVKQSMAEVERHVTKPLIQKFVDDELMFSTDEAIRGDIQVQVNGVRSLAEKEAKEGSIQWAIQSLAPFAKGVQIPSSVILRLIRELFEQQGIDTKDLPDYSYQDAMDTDLFNQGQIGDGMQGAPTAGGGNPTEYLDGRSQTAINQIEGE